MIREMRCEDWNRVKDIYRQALERGISTFNTQCPSFEEWDASHCKECRYVYEENGVVCGWITIAPTSGRWVYRGAVEVSVYVDEAWQNKGIGTALLSHLCSESEKNGYWSLYSAIFSINESSIKLHEKCGFRVIGTREKIAKDKYGIWQDTTLMEKRSQKIV